MFKGVMQLVLGIGFTGLFAFNAHAWEAPSRAEIRFRIRAEILHSVIADHPEIPEEALTYAFRYLDTHDSLVTNQNYLTVIDFNQPSTAERMYVIDLSTSAVFTYLVAHGQGSGLNYATHFSNRPQSKMSSLGIYLTGEDYAGQHGLSMRLKGQEVSNSLAEERDIVLHPADYVSYEMIWENGRLGRSWGCPAVSPQYSEELVRMLKDGSVFYIYHSTPPLKRM